MDDLVVENDEVFSIVEKEVDAQGFDYTLESLQQ